jgi:predicted nuclease with RNAse H fold
VLTKIITFIDTINASVIAAQMGHQLAAEAKILCCDTEEERREFPACLESMRELSRNGQEISRFIMDGFRDIKQQIYEVRSRIEILIVTAQLFER